MIPEKPSEIQELFELNIVEIHVGIDLERGAVAIHLPELKTGASSC
jgi:hypothetical protein